MEFNLQHIIAQLERGPAIYQQWLSGIPESWETLNEGPNTWSAFDIIGHLIHGERTDWIPRANIILSGQSTQAFEPFDRFAQEQVSQGKTLQALLDTFASLRKANVETLRSWQLSEQQLNLQGTHPDLGTVTLRELLSTWASHDLGHIYQLSRVWVKAFGPHIGPWQAYSRILKEK